MTNKDILDFLKWEKENLLRIVGDNKSEFNLGRIYAIDKMIDGVEGVFIDNLSDSTHLQEYGSDITEEELSGHVVFRRKANYGEPFSNN